MSAPEPSDRPSDEAMGYVNAVYLAAIEVGYCGSDQISLHDAGEKLRTLGAFIASLESRLAASEASAARLRDETIRECDAACEEAWTRCAQTEGMRDLITDAQSRMLALPLRAPSVTPEMTDGKRWRALCRLAEENHRRVGLGGGIVLWTADGNEHDPPMASIQALDHENPRQTLWIHEGHSLDEAIDAARARQAAPAPGA